MAKNDDDAMDVVPCDYVEVPDQELGRHNLVKCEVTGELIDADQAFTFQGKQVSAEGKKILIRQMMGGGRPNGDHLPRPGFWRRFVCFLLDGVAVFMLTIIATTILGISIASNDPRESIQLELLSAVISFVYLAFMHGAFGQTLGKMMGGIQVMDLNAQPITYGRAALRGFWSSGIFCIPLFIAVSSIAWALIAGLFLRLYSTVNCVALIANTTQHRALHDRLSGTRVYMYPAEEIPGTGVRYRTLNR